MVFFEAISARLTGRRLRQGWRWFSTSQSALLVLAILYVVPRLLLLALSIQPSSDAEWYYGRAIGLSRGEGYLDWDGTPTAFWPPGWPLAMAAAFRAFGASLAVVGGLNLAMSLLTGLLTLRLGPRIFPHPAAGRIGVLLLAIYPNNALYVPLALSEVFYTGLLLAAVALLVMRAGLVASILCGLLLGAAILVKTQTVLLLPLLFVVSIGRDIAARRPILRLRRAFWGVLITSIAALAVVAPWSLRNHAVFNQWIFVSTNGGYSLLVGNNPNASAPFRTDDPWILKFNADKRQMGDVRYDAFARAQAVRWMASHPGDFVKLMPVKFTRLWLPDGESLWAYEMGAPIWSEAKPFFLGLRIFNQLWYLGLLALGAIAGLALLWQRRRHGQPILDWWLVPYLMAFHATAICLIFSGQSRYHYPVMPWLCMAGGWLLAIWADRVLGSPHRAG